MPLPKSETRLRLRRDRSRIVLMLKKAFRKHCLQLSDVYTNLCITSVTLLKRIAVHLHSHRSNKHLPASNNPAVAGRTAYQVSIPSESILQGGNGFNSC